MSRTKPKENRKGDPNTSQIMDQCQTPMYAVEILLPYLKNCYIWEPAAGKGYICEYLAYWGYFVQGSDIIYDETHNFFIYDIAKDPEVHGPYEDTFEWDVIVTNPPYSIKYQWIQRCLELGKPFALLVPVETIATQRFAKFVEQYGEFEYIIPHQRVDFIMPNKGTDGAGAQFPVLWLTKGLNIGQTITRVKMNKPNRPKRKQTRDDLLESINNPPILPVELPVYRDWDTGRLLTNEEIAEWKNT